MSTCSICTLGMVVFWNLPTNSPLQRIRLSDGSLKLYPFQCFLAHDQAVRTIQWCKANRYRVRGLWSGSWSRPTCPHRLWAHLPFFQSFPGICGEWSENQILGSSTTLWTNKLYQALLEYRAFLAAPLQWCHSGSRQLLCLVRQDEDMSSGDRPCGLGCRACQTVGKGELSLLAEASEFWTKQCS